MTTLPKFETSTRLTSPEPTGIEKAFQDDWDAKRESQVRTYMTYDTDTSFRNFVSAVKRGIDVCAAGPPVSKDAGLTITTVYGSYDRTDKYKKNGDENKSVAKELENNMRRLGHDNTYLINRYMKSKNVVIIKQGIRTTSTLHYTDGTYDVMDPTKGIMMTGEKELKDIKPIETFYVILVKEGVASDMD